ncbi:MAG: capsule assembly Wzi family protein [Prevotella sp.]|jgi:hypothetical protein
MTRTIAAWVFAFWALQAGAQSTDTERLRWDKGLTYKLETQTSLSKGETPLWLNANKYGLSSLESSNGYVRAAVVRPLGEDSLRRWGIGYGVDVAAAYNYTSKAIVQQAFFQVRWLKGVFTVGSKEWPMELKNNQLSSGSQTLGINARPIPQVRLALEDYWKVFGLRWLRLKGHVAFGRMTDDNWQKDFTNNVPPYIEDRLYHSKAGYLLIGNPDAFTPFTVELGLEMAAMFGGTSYMTIDGETVAIDNGSGLRSFWNAFVPGGSDATDGSYQNVEGDDLGSWVARINYEADTWGAHLYADKFFEDHSSMFMLDYDGYGEGEDWDVSSKRRYLLYNFKDWMLGAELNMKYGRWIRDIVFEYLYTEYQSGPIYHDHSSGVSDHIGGRDNYYNHHLYTGWQHWGQAIGNPLYTSPIYNKSGVIRFENNRFLAFHFGMSGRPTERLTYRLMATYEEGLGTYDIPFTSKRHNVSAMLEAAYQFPKGWYVKGAAGMDMGGLLGHNYGFQLTVSKSGLLQKSKRITQ